MKKILAVLLAFSVCTVFASCGCDRTDDDPLTHKIPSKITQVTPEGTVVYTYDWSFSGKSFKRTTKFTDPDNNESTDITEYQYTTDSNGKIVEIVATTQEGYKFTNNYTYDDKGRLISQDDNSYTFKYNDKGFDFALYDDEGKATTNKDGYVTGFDYTDYDKNNYKCEFKLDEYNNATEILSEVSMDGELMYSVESTLADIVYDGENIKSAKLYQKTNMDEEISEGRELLKEDETATGDEVDDSNGNFEFEYDSMGYPTKMHYSDIYENSVNIEIEYKDVSEKNFIAITSTDVNPFTYQLNQIISLGDYNLFYFIGKTNALKCYTLVSQSAITFNIGQL